jgi:hypothetical protein
LLRRYPGYAAIDERLAAATPNRRPLGLLQQAAVRKALALVREFAAEAARIGWDASLLSTRPRLLPTTAAARAPYLMRRLEDPGAAIPSQQHEEWGLVTFPPLSAHVGSPTILCFGEIVLLGRFASRPSSPSP